MPANHYLEKATRQQVEGYLGFWLSLTPMERKVYIKYEIFYWVSGRLGQLIGATDICDHCLTGCWNISGKPVNFPTGDPS